MTPRQAEAQALWEETRNKAEVARRMGIGESSVRELLQRAGVTEPPGVTAALAAAQAQGAEAVWLKSKEASILWRRPKEEADPQAFLDALRSGLADIPRAAHMDPPSGPSDRLAVFPVADLHMGLLTDEEETGEDWNGKRAQDVFSRAFDRVVQATPAAGTAILAQLGDLLHIDDQRNVTPQHGHQLDADSRYFLTLRRAVAAMKGAIETLRAHYPSVVYRGCRGNHDLTAHHAVTLALAEYYADVPGVRIVQSAAEFYVHEFGANMLVLHHGDRVKPDRLAHFVADRYATVWGRTKHRLSLSGHVHHMKAQEVGGIVCESIGTIIPRDAYADSHGYTGRRALVSITLDRHEGEVSRARVGV